MYVNERLYSSNSFPKIIKDLEDDLATERRVLARVLDILADWTDWRKDVGILARDEDFHSSHGGCCRCSTCNRHHDDCVCSHNEIQAALDKVRG